MQRAWSRAHNVKSLCVEERKEIMNRREIRKIDTRIKVIGKAAEELKELSAGIPAIDRNAVRILASVKMLEINISDVKDLV